MPNLIVAYDLYIPGQRYTAVEQAILRLGIAVKLLNTTWYVKTNMSATEVRGVIAAQMDLNDRLLVVDANNATGWNINQNSWANVLQQWSI